MQMRTAYAGSSILLERASTAIPDRLKLARELRQRLADVQDAAKQVEHLGSCTQVNQTTLDSVRRLVHWHGREVYSLPYLSPEFCHDLLSTFEAAEYSVNHEEEPEARIPEIVLEQRSKPLFDCLTVLFEHAIRPLCTVLWNLTPERLTSIQAAQYSVEEQPGTAFHHDADSDITLVVNLGTEFEGGGTLVAGGLSEADLTVPPLPIGHAMMFKGKTQLHRGLPVTSGIRTLLVHWSIT